MCANENVETEIENHSIAGNSDKKRTVTVFEDYLREVFPIIKKSIEIDD